MARVPAPGVPAGTPVRTQASDELVADIARHLAGDGEYELTLLPDMPQELVDVRWAALRAGRVLGRRVHVAVSGLTLDSAKTPLTVRMTCPAGTTRPTIPHQRAQG
jgi:hypothetical protein